MGQVLQEKVIKMKALKERKIKVDMQIFRRRYFGLLSELGMLYGVVFYLSLCQVEQIFFRCYLIACFRCYAVVMAAAIFQENAEYIESWIHSRISHNRISRNLRQCCPGRYLLSCFDKGYDC